MKTGPTSTELSGKLSNHCNTENNHDPITEIQLGYQNICTNNFQLLPINKLPGILTLQTMLIFIKCIVLVVYLNCIK